MGPHVIKQWKHFQNDWLKMQSSELINRGILNLIFSSLYCNIFLVFKPVNIFSLIRAFGSPGLMFTGQEAGLVGHIFL